MPYYTGDLSHGWHVGHDMHSADDAIAAQAKDDYLRERTRLRGAALEAFEAAVSRGEDAAEEALA